MFETNQLSENVIMRVLRQSDAPALTDAYERNRSYLTPWEPVRSEEYFIEEWQDHDLYQTLLHD